jgi:hypothetical protein
MHIPADSLIHSRGSIAIEQNMTSLQVLRIWPVLKVLLKGVLAFDRRDVALVHLNVGGAIFDGRHVGGEIVIELRFRLSSDEYFGFRCYTAVNCWQWL